MTRSLRIYSWLLLHRRPIVEGLITTDDRQDGDAARVELSMLQRRGRESRRLRRQLANPKISQRFADKSVSAARLRK